MGTPATPGALVLYWHGTGGTMGEAASVLGTETLDAVVGAGGVVASFSQTVGLDGAVPQGQDTGDGVWYTGDFAIADQVVACAVQQGRIDPRQIDVMGASAGGLQTTWMSYARSAYVAAAGTYSGGLLYANEAPLQDPTHVPPAVAVHGTVAGDTLAGFNFANASTAWESDLSQRGVLSVDCNTGGGHVSGEPANSPGIWQFFQDHPYGVVQNYPAGLPTAFESYCVAVNPTNPE